MEFPAVLGVSLTSWTTDESDGLQSQFLALHFQMRLPDCVNSSPPLILRKFQGFGGIWANSGNFGKIQGNSVEFSGVLYGA